MVMRFGTWNVRALLQAGNMNMIAEERKNTKKSTGVETNG
jgi:hypothetical protein